MSLRFSSSTRIIACACTVALVLSPTVVAAQGGQRFGFQVAALSTTIGNDNDAITGYGAEVQLRANTFYSNDKLALSVGAGPQVTAHSKASQQLTIGGVFLEPRIVPSLPFTRVFPYISGRVAYLRQSSNFGTASWGLGYGGGIGAAIPLTKTLNLDAGYAVVRQSYGDFEIQNGGSSVSASYKPFTTYAAKIGLSWGFPNK